MQASCHRWVQAVVSANYRLVQFLALHPVAVLRLPGPRPKQARPSLHHRYHSNSNRYFIT